VALVVGQPTRYFDPNFGEWTFEDFSQWPTWMGQTVAYNNILRVHDVSLKWCSPNTEWYA
jgi:hypothetical protein